MPTAPQVVKQRSIIDNQISKRAEEQSLKKQQETKALEREQALAKERQERERLEKERIASERQERERLEKNRWEKERQDNDRLERERTERLERERLEKERANKVRQERERFERLERERLEKERLEKERLETERLQQSQEVLNHADVNTVIDGMGAVALYDYQKDEDNEIDLREGENISNVIDVGEGWYSGTNSSGNSGLFPGNYVQLTTSGTAGVQPVQNDQSSICAVALVNDSFN